ncbi:MarR family transcriptional regulator [Paenibacillus sp. VCA1]|uniref:MarR family winged helix-turn-helix transcriptional regulator n=1 Tax=Paenibacillus sp. VCA1 TaxID=3039148 RepID=UPI002871E57F|nr:MarR family transcriptional regulator [Paenibacillus sp. VCA1]MDR9857572.1 MarR family transcriptional regulator [Paenibacillus sp. VCA1]
MNDKEKDWARMEEADWHFRKLVRRFVKERDKITIEGVPLPGMLILNTIMRDGEQRLGDLGEQLDFTSGAVTAICDKLEGLGFAVRKRSESDRRAVSLDITEQGKEMLERHKEAGTYMIDTLFGSFSPAELDHLSSLFGRLHARLDGFADAVIRTTKPSEKDKTFEAEGHAKSGKRSNRFVSY